MSLKTKLQNWQSANLITPNQVDAITAYEQENHKGLFKNGLIYIAFFSILLGISLIIAANWNDINQTLKLVVHFALNITLTGLIIRWRNNPARAFASDIALFMLWGLTLTLIALIGQTFQLSGNTWDATRFWFLITTPMMLFLAQSRYLTALWGLFFVLFIPFDIISNFIDNIDKDAYKATAAVALFGAMPPALYVASKYLRPNMATTFKNLSWLLALGAASFAGIAFYFGSETTFYPAHTAPVAAIIIGTLLLLRPKFEKSFIDIFILTTLFITLPGVIPYKGDLLAMLHMLALWLGAGFIFQRGNHYKMLNLAIIVITARLFIGFLELFGSMMTSGLGFILMGLTLIALLYAARRIKQVLAK